MAYIPSRDEALDLLKHYNQQENLVKHALAVEAVMRHFSGFFEQEDPDTWGIVGLLHDLDYEQFPDLHCQKTREILTRLDMEPSLVRAIVSHGYGICSDIKPESSMEKVLYTIDELTGLVVATTLMRPSRSLFDLSVKSLKKKFKSPAFAAGVNRDIIKQGAEWMGWTLDDVFRETINGMRKIAEDLGLAGNSETT
jgi:predicted hydrolase (HD superfamily)